MYEVGITNETLIAEAIGLTGSSLIYDLKAIPGLENETAWEIVVYAGQVAYAASYKVRRREGPQCSFVTDCFSPGIVCLLGQSRCRVY